MAMRLGGWIALAAASALWLAAPAAAQEVPVWWSPTLGIESLGDIDAILDEPFAAQEVRRMFRVRVINNSGVTDEADAIGGRALIRLVS
jgi:hypothetical protein